MRIQLLTVFLCLVFFSGLTAAPFSISLQDSSVTDTSLAVRGFVFKKDSLFTEVTKNVLIQDQGIVSLYPAVSLQQSLKGKASGLYINESTGEPGSLQQMFIDGISMPLLTKKDVYQSQPLVVLDGIPLIIDEHPFAFDLQSYDYNRIGTATNLLAGIDLNNIKQIEVLKDMVGISVYGPRGANGVIVLTSKAAESKKKINFSTYFGFVQRPSVTTINGDFENNFRRQFYDRYTANGRYSEDDTYPVYLSDSLNNSYFGASNWSDLYYGNEMIHSVTADISGGSERANFRFSVGNMRNRGIAEKTSLDRYSAMFSINMSPLEWIQFSAMVNGNRLERNRNKNLRDRFAQMNYTPDLSAPLAPNKDVYRGYLNQFKNSFDENNTNLIQGHARLAFDFNKIKFFTRLAVDYSEGYRDLFYPRTVMEENSYASNYYGFSQRLMLENVLTFSEQFNERNKFFLEAGNTIQWDQYKYNNSYAYKGLNDFIKINLLESDPNSDNYLTPLAFPRELVYKFLDRTSHNLVSFYGKASYNFDEKYTLSFLLRGDGSSNAQPTKRWIVTPALGFTWNVKKDLFESSQVWSDLVFRINAGRLGRLNAYDNFSQGPQYTAEASYTGNMINPGYNGFAILSRPYDFGWVGYNIPWAYSDRLSVGIDAGWLNNRIRLSVDGYIKEDKNQILAIPSHSEYGYSQSYESGLNMRNRGVDLMISAQVLAPNKNVIGWTSSLNLGYNENQLTRLPGGLQELIIGNRLLKVGERADRFWVYTNEGIYLADQDVPVKDGQLLSYNGNVLQAGDPRWKDMNGDNVINDEDKTLKGNIFPKIVGGLENEFQYNNWTLNTHLYFNLGRKVLQQEMANRFDFINREGTSSIESVKEITFWEKRGDYSKYPLYNPWSVVRPYQAEQDLFLENASFLKLRSVTLGYDLTSWLKSRNSKIEGIYIYGSANNLFTISPYSGRDPELIDYTGYDTGYGMAIPKTFTLGIRMSL